VLWATRKFYRDKTPYVAQINELLRELHHEFGWRSRLAAPIAGRYLYSKLKKQQQMLEEGWTYEPPTFYETNFSAGPTGSEYIKTALACGGAPLASVPPDALIPVSS